MRKGFTLIELCIVLAIMAGMAALTMPSISKLVKRMEHIQRVNEAIQKVYDKRKESYEDGLTWDGDVWYTPFQCSPHVIIVDNQKIIVREFYEIVIRPVDTK